MYISCVLQLIVISLDKIILSKNFNGIDNVDVQYRIRNARREAMFQIGVVSNTHSEKQS